MSFKRVTLFWERTKRGPRALVSVRLDADQVLEIMIRAQEHDRTFTEELRSTIKKGLEK
jgi:hypothetical protein